MTTPGSGKRVATVLGFAAIQSVLAVASISLNEMGRFAVTGHHELFYKYANQAMSGQIPYRDFLVEYPLLSFPLMIAPRLVASSPGSYSAVFVAMLLGFNLALLALVARWVEQAEGFARVPVALGWYTLFLVALCPLALGPFDLAPTLLVFLAACAWSTGKNGWGGVIAGLGVLMKVFPGAVALPGLILEASRIRQSRLRGTLAFVVTVALGLAAWFLIAGRGLVDSLVYQTERGLQVESTWAGLVFLQGCVDGSSGRLDPRPLLGPHCQRSGSLAGASGVTHAGVDLRGHRLAVWAIGEDRHQCATRRRRFSVSSSVARCSRRNS